MIKNLFLPEQIKGYYLFTTRIIGFDIGKTSIKAASILCKGKQITVEKFFEEPVQAAEQTDYQDRAAAAIKIILQQAGSYDHIVCALPSSQAIFKEIKVPFIGSATIKKIIAYEVEPLLPFALSDAVIDCIVTKEILEEKSSEVLVAAVQNQYIAQLIALFATAQANPEKITIDFFALYGLFRLIPAYAQQKGGIVLLDVEPHDTRIAYIYDQQLRFIRTLPKGLLDQARVVAQKMNITEPEALEHIVRFGLEKDHNDAYIAAISQAFTAFFNDISFTLQSFTSQAKPAQSIHKIIIFGAGATIKGLPEFVSQVCHAQTELFALNGLLHNSNTGFTVKTTLNQSQCISLACALPQTSTADFNLRQKEFAPSTQKTILLKLAVAVGLMLLTLGALAFNTFWQLRRLQREGNALEQEAVIALKDKFKKIPDDVQSLDEVIGEAKTQVNREEKLWSGFSNESRPRFLKYLLELTTKIDKAGTGLDVEKLTLTQDTITLKGSVRGWDELKALETDLGQSKLFSKVEPSSDTKFTKTIRIAKRAQE
jgi:type IV pilus assembly protein PilM